MIGIKSRLHRTPSHVPPGPRGHILFGVTRDARRDFLQFGLQLRENYGNIVRYRFFGRYGYQLNHPEYIQHVLQDNHRNYRKSRAIVTRLHELAGNGLLTSEGEFWLRQRRLAQPAFHRKRIEGFAETMTNAAETMMEQWEQQVGETLDVAEEMMRLTLRIAGKTLFGLDLLDQARDVGEAFDVVSSEMVNFPVLYVLLRTILPTGFPLPTPRNPRFEAGLQQLDEVVRHIIEERRQSGEDRGDLLSMFMFAVDEETGEQMNDRQLRDEVMTMMLAGHETTALALTWTWYLLAQHPEVEARLHEEVDKVLGGRSATIDDLPALPYTSRVIEESLRLYPPAHSFNRQAIHQDEIDGYTIPRGAHILIQPYVVHRHPDFWENPDSFDPDRFGSQRSQGRHKYAYIPFGGGPRLCIGKTFALTEAQLILATVAQRFRLDLVPDHEVVLQPLITLRPQNGMRLTLSRR